MARQHGPEPTGRTPAPTGTLALFLAGDVMLGRGIDQIMPQRVDPRIHELFMKSAEGYVALAEQASGAIPRPVGHDYVWGDGLAELGLMGPDLRVVNLETAITTSETYAPKGINYRMHPGNVPCLSAAAIDCCVLANNHVLDWGEAGLVETLTALERHGIRYAGAGRDDREASQPAVLETAKGARVLVFGFGAPSSGIPRSWAAAPARPGIDLIEDLSPRTVRRIATRVSGAKRTADIAVASIHWGGNWGYEISAEERRFARQLIDEAGIDIVHGHSSHHPKGVEVHAGRPILYGCGDLINDYEGIAGYEAFRGDLSLMYFVEVAAASGRLKAFTMAPFRMRRFRLNRAAPGDAAWLRRRLDEVCRPLGTRIEPAPGGRFRLAWSA